MEIETAWFVLCLTVCFSFVSEHPHIQVVYRVKEILATYGMDIIYAYVEMVRRGEFFRVTLASRTELERPRGPRAQEPVGFDELSVGDR